MRRASMSLKSQMIYQPYKKQLESHELSTQETSTVRIASLSEGVEVAYMLLIIAYTGLQVGHAELWDIMRLYFIFLLHLNNNYLEILINVIKYNF